MDYRQVLPAKTLLDRKYRVERVIGAGGFGITYEAYDVGLETPVAIKEYFPDQFGIRDSTMTVAPRTESDRTQFVRWRQSFVQEARTLASFDHPSIVRVLSVFEAHGTAYLAMKFEDGPSLKSWLGEIGRPASQDELDRITGPLLDALEVVHNKRFLHRDISPDNIILRRDGSPILIDFGATRRQVNDVSRAMTGIVKNGYSPQEQYATDGRLQGPWTDIYALGATLHRCISGRVPPEAAERLLHDRMPPAASFAKNGYRPEFLAAIDACLQVRPKDRPQTVGELRKLMFRAAARPGEPIAVAPAARTSTPVGPHSAPGSHPNSRPEHGRTSGPSVARSAPAPAQHTSPPSAPAAPGRSQPSAPVRSSPSATGAGGAPPRSTSHPAAPSWPTPPEPAPASSRRWVFIVAALALAFAIAAVAYVSRSSVVGNKADASAPAVLSDQRPQETAAERNRLALIKAELAIAEANRTDELRRTEEARRHAATPRVDEARQAVDAPRVASAEPPPAARPPQVRPQAPAPEPVAELQPQTAAAPPPPVDPVALTRSIQKELLRVGCSPGSDDGVWSSGVRQAMEQFVRLTGASNLKTDAPAPETLAVLNVHRDRVCPLRCGDGEVASGGRCVARPAVAQPKPVVKPAPPSQAVAKADPQQEKGPRQRPIARETTSARSGGGGDGLRGCRQFPRPRPGEACRGANGRTCVQGGGAGSCS